MCNLVIEPFKMLPCALETFLINGIPARADDFVEDDDESNDGYNEFWDPDDDTDDRYACHCKCVKGLELTEAQRSELARKYHLTDSEIEKVISALESALYVGYCNLCT